MEALEVAQEYGLTSMAPALASSMIKSNVIANCGSIEKPSEPYKPLVYETKKSPEYMAELYRNNFKDNYAYKVGKVSGGFCFY
jgi:hypothetical protein